MATQLFTKRIRWQDFKVVDPDAYLVQEVAQRNRWNCKVVGHGEMIKIPMKSGKWALYPAHMWESTIPAEGLQRVYQLVNAGARIKGLVVADDGRRKKSPLDIAAEFVKSDLVAKAVLGIATVVAIAILTTALIALAAIALVAIGLPMLIAAALAYDPILVAVLEDGTWVSLYEWYE